MDAAKELQSLVDDNKHKITEEGFYLELSNAVMKVHERAAALDETSDASEEEESEEAEGEDGEEDDDWGWEDGDTPADSLASRAIHLVEFHDPDYVAHLVNGLHVSSPLHTRRPTARAMAVVQLLKGLDLNDPLNVAKMRRWKQHVLSWNAHNMFSYLLKQHWLDDYYGVDADPRPHIIEIVELLGDNDVAFRQLMQLRGVYRALNELVTNSHVSDLRAAAYRLLEKVRELFTD